MYKKFGKVLIKIDDLSFAVKLNSISETIWNNYQRPLVETIINFFNDRQMVNEGVKIHIDWDKENNRWYYIYFENIDDASLFEVTCAEYF
jgi:hypothetical protein